MHHLFQDSLSEREWSGGLSARKSFSFFENEDIIFFALERLLSGKNITNFVACEVWNFEIWHRMSLMYFSGSWFMFFGLSMKI